MSTHDTWRRRDDAERRAVHPWCDEKPSAVLAGLVEIADEIGAELVNEEGKIPNDRRVRDRLRGRHAGDHCINISSVNERPEFVDDLGYTAMAIFARMAPGELAGCEAENATRHLLERCRQVRKGSLCGYCTSRGQVFGIWGCRPGAEMGPDGATRCALPTGNWP